jgi:photosystem II stability/assembly factor-like uncharacterized protein
MELVAGSKAFQMRHFQRYLIAALMSFLVACAGACHSNVSPQNVSKGNSQNDTGEPIGDPEWGFKPLKRLPDDSKQRRVRCNRDRVCWVWNEHTIWIGDAENPWRVFYSLAALQKPNLEINSAYLESAQTGWIVQGHVLYKTEDGGHSLHPVSLPGIESEVRGLITDLSFVDKDHGWIVGGRFEPLRPGDPLINAQMTRGQIRTACIFQTLDGGATWLSANLPRLIGPFDQIDFSEDGVGIASSRNNLVFTNDNGKTWLDLTKYFPSIGKGDESERATFCDAFFLDSKTGWLLFSGFQFEALATGDGGKSWTKTTWPIETHTDDTSSLPPNPRFAFVDNSHGLFVYNHLYGGELFKTSDAGKTWKQIVTSGSNHEVFYDLSFGRSIGGFLVSNERIHMFSLR